MAAAAFSCSKAQPEYVELVRLGGKPKTVQAEASVDTCSLEVISDGEYAARIIQGVEWACFPDGSHSLEGSGNGSIEVVVNANTGIRRTAKIVLEHGTRSDTLRINQKCRPEYEESVTLSSTAVTILPEGGSVTVPFTTNVPLHLITPFAYSDRILDLRMTDGRVSFQVGPNRSFNPLNTKVTLSFIDGWEQKQSAEINVFQNFLDMNGMSDIKSSETMFTIGTYNLWATSARESEKKAGNAVGDRLWPESKKAVAQCIADMDIDILGVQEADAGMIADITSYLKSNGADRSSLFFFPDEEHHEKQSADGILFRSSRFELVSADRYWISPTPDVQSYGWDEGARQGVSYQYRYRNAVCCHFYDKYTAKDFVVTVIHGPQYPEARSHASEIMIEMEKKYNSERYPAFFIGDMNAPDLSEPFNAGMRKYCSDSREIAASSTGPEFTFAGSGSDAAPSKRLDYIYLHSDAGDAFDVSGYHVNDARYKVNDSYYYPSDHLPVYIEVKLR